MATMEYERKFLVREVPELESRGSSLRQGYVATDGDVAVRIRSVDDVTHRLTVKGGRGAVRTEVECDLEPEEFTALWPLTDGRRIEKTRYVVALSPSASAAEGDSVPTVTGELDVFAGALEGLLLVEVEFGDEETMSAFRPPVWFGPEVTDDRRYTNAALATSGWPTE